MRVNLTQKGVLYPFASYVENAGSNSARSGRVGPVTYVNVAAYSRASCFAVYLFPDAVMTKEATDFTLS